MINKGESILTHVDKKSRESTCRNHSSIHLLQKTLQEKLNAQYDNIVKLYNDNNSYSIRRYRIHNCYFELLDEYREDKTTSGVVVDFRK